MRMMRLKIEVSTSVKACYSVPSVYFERQSLSFFCHAPEKWGVRYPHSKKCVCVCACVYAYPPKVTPMPSPPYLCPSSLPVPSQFPPSSVPSLSYPGPLPSCLFPPLSLSVPNPLYPSGDLEIAVTSLAVTSPMAAGPGGARPPKAFSG